MQTESEYDTEALLERLGLGKLGMRLRKSGAELARRQRVEAVVHEAVGRRKWRLLERRLGEEVRKAADTGPEDWLGDERTIPKRAERRAQGR